jgi:hypothetical protein
VNWARVIAEGRSKFFLTVSYIKQVKISVRGYLTGELNENAHLYIISVTRIANPGLPALLGPVPLSLDSQVCASQRNPPLSWQLSDKKKNTFISLMLNTSQESV